MVEMEGNGNSSFAQFVVIEIQEEEPENFSMGGQQVSLELIEKMSRKI